jgi:hypothetical protein
MYTKPWAFWSNDLQEHSICRSSKLVDKLFISKIRVKDKLPIWMANSVRQLIYPCSLEVYTVYLQHCGKSSCLACPCAENFTKCCFVGGVLIQNCLLHSELNTGCVTHETSILPISYCFSYPSDPLTVNMTPHSTEKMSPHKASHLSSTSTSALIQYHDQSSIIFYF